MTVSRNMWHCQLLTAESLQCWPLPGCDCNTYSKLKNHFNSTAKEAERSVVGINIFKISSLQLPRDTFSSPFHVLILVVCSYSCPSLSFSSPVWPDWSIFGQSFVQKLPKYLMTFWAILKHRTLIDRISSWPNGFRSILTKNVNF